jgi:hypothetical protein
MHREQMFPITSEQNGKVPAQFLHIRISF